jgi:hypothetical protein
MKEQIQQKIEEWVDSEQVESKSLDMSDDEQIHFTIAYNQALQDLRSKAPQLA